MYPMRLHKREIHDMKEMQEILEECKVVRIGSCDEHGMFIVPMNFGYVFSEEERRRHSKKMCRLHLKWTVRMH